MRPVLITHVNHALVLKERSANGCGIEIMPTLLEMFFMNIRTQNFDIRYPMRNVDLKIKSNNHMRGSLHG